MESKTAFSNAASSIANLYSSLFEATIEAGINGKLEVYKEALKTMEQEPSLKNVPFCSLVNSLDSKYQLNMSLKGVKLKESKKRIGQMEIEDDEEEKTNKKGKI